MKYRKLDSNGDYSFGQSRVNFLESSPATVAQAILTRLRMAKGESFINTSDGTPYDTEIRGHGTAAVRDLAMRSRILGTVGVTDIESFSSSVNPVTRSYNVTATVNTVYGKAVIENADLGI